MSHSSARPHGARYARRIILGTLPVLALLGLGAVLSSGISTASAQARESSAPAAGAKAWVRVAHLVPGLGAARLDLQPAGTAEGTSIQMSPSAEYGDVTAYQQLAPGSYTIRVSNSGSSATAAPMLSRSLRIVSDKAYTLAVLGTSEAPRLATLTDDLTPPQAGQARVRILSAASQAPQVTVTAENGPTLVENAVLGEATDYAAVPGGTWNLTARISTDLQVRDAIKVTDGSVYTLVLLDGESGTPRLSLLTDAAGTAAAPQGGAATGAGAMAATLTESGASGRTSAFGPAGMFALGAVVLGLAGALAGLVARSRRLDSHP